MFSLKKTALALAFVALGNAAVGCGQLESLVGKSAEESASIISDENETSQLITDSLNSASGSGEEFLRPYKLDGIGGGPEHGPGQHRPGYRGGHGPRGDHPSKRMKGPPPLSALPADIQALMKAADAKKDSILGIDRAKVEEVLKAMRTDLEAARAVAASRDDFKAQAKVIQDKYVAQLKTILPAFDSLTQDQKDRVKALHDAQRAVITSCVVPGADAAGSACTDAKAALQAKIDAP